MTWNKSHFRCPRLLVTMETVRHLPISLSVATHSCWNRSCVLGSILYQLTWRSTEWWVVCGIASFPGYHGWVHEILGMRLCVVLLCVLMNTCCSSSPCAKKFSFMTTWNKSIALWLLGLETNTPLINYALPQYALHFLLFLNAIMAVIHRLSNICKKSYIGKTKGHTLYKGAYWNSTQVQIYS